MSCLAALLTVAACAADAPRTDSFGDPLPPGALFRFGSIRLRHDDGICNSALSPDGKSLATAGNSAVVVWDLATGKAVRRFDCEIGNRYSRPGIAFSPDGRRLAHARGPHCLCVWDVKTGKQLCRLGAKGSYLDALCQFTRDGKALALVFSGKIHFRDPEADKELRSVAVGHASLLSPGATAYLRIEKEWQSFVLGDTRTGKVTARFTAAVARNGIQDGVAISPNGAALALVDQKRKTVEVRDIAGGRVRASFPLPASAGVKQGEFNPREAIGNMGEYHVGFLGDDKTLFLTTKAGIVHLWNLDTGKELAPLRNPLGGVAAVHVLPGGKTLITTGDDGQIRRWDATTGRELTETLGYVGRTCAACSPVELRVAVGDGRGRLDLWDASNGKLLRPLVKEGSAVTGLAFSPDGATLAVALASGVVQIREVSSGRQRKVFPWKGKDGLRYVPTLLFSPDGRLLGVCDKDRLLRLWDIDTGKVRWHGWCDWVAAIAPDGKTLTGVFGDISLIFLDLPTGTKRLKVRLAPEEERFGLMNRVDALAYSPDGRLLALARTDGHISLCDAGTGATLKQFKAVGPRPPFANDPVPLRFGYRVNSLAFSPDSKWLVSGGEDRAVRVWEVATGTEVLRLDGQEAGVTKVDFSADGRTVLSCGWGAQAYLWDLRPKRVGNRTPETLWNGLGGEPVQAYRAVWAMSEDPKAASALLRRKLEPVRPVEKRRLDKLIADLNGKRFQVRAAAARALAELDDLAVPALEEVLRGRPSLEVRRRVQALLDTCKRGPSPTRTRRLRAVQVLELAGTEDARAVLRAWAGGVPEARFTSDARAALRRLEKRDRPRP